MPVNLTKIESSLSPQRIDLLPRAPFDSLYIHVPFCEEKCRYCDFYSITSRPQEEMEKFVDSVLTELRWWMPRLQDQQPVSTIFLGGGTPSALPPGAMQRLLNGIHQMIPISPEVEWSIEANPATVDGDYCKLLLECGVNRLSIGGQSFVESELQMLGRIHDAQTIARTVETALQAGFRRVSVDLMYAVPGQTLESWLYSLESATRLGIRHISCYCLTLEEGTAMWAQTRSGKLPAVPEETQLQFMRFTRNWLRDRGLPPYEISNYAAPGEECRHNLVYWESGNYLGLGPAAASNLAGFRWRNAPNLKRYLDAVLSDQRVPVADVETLDANQRATELVMLMLRLTKGLGWRRMREISQLDGAQLMRAAVKRLSAMGLLVETADGIRLTDEGCYVADEVISELVREVS